MATVLVVDDSAFMRMRCVAIVKEQGHEAVEAGDGKEAIEVYKQKRPQAVLMDITMPNTDGLTALREIVAFDPNAKVAMITAMGQQGIVMEALKAGARDFVVKPFEPDRVKVTLQKLLG
jgi:two-component system chemotaxis response regulator CheY